MTNDAELLRRYCRERSEAAFRELVARHVNLVYGAALRRSGGNTQQAEDVVQTVFVALAREAPRLRRHPSLVGWLFTAARNAAINAGVAEKRRQEREAQGAELMQPETAEQIDWGQLRGVLDEAMDSLSARDRELILIRYFEGESVADIGQRLGIRENAARMRLERALDRMQRALRRRGIVSTGAGLASAITAFGKPAAPEWLAPAATNAALSAAPAVIAGTGLVSALTFMTKTKTLITAASLVVAGFIAYDWSERHAATELAAERDRTERETGRITGRINSLGRQQADLQRAITLIESSRSAKAATTAPIAPNGTVSPIRPFLMDPTYRAVFLVAQLARCRIQFQEFYRQNGLVPPQTDRFEELMAERDLSSLDLQNARDLGQDETPINQRSGAIWNAGMDELLGLEKKKALAVFQRSMALREFVNTLATPMFPLNDPVTPAQTAQLAEIALAHDATFQSGKGTDPSKVDWAAVWEPASAVISPEQLATFQRLVEAWTLKHDIATGLARSP